jgi:protocatechuate 3,4-dioxygenase beta subunit
MAHATRSMMIAVLLASTAYAGAAVAETCVPTPAVATANYPGVKSIPHSNNLLLPAGKSIAAEGKKLIVNVQLVDKNCMPIPDVVVELWQADPNGRWMLAGADDLVTPNPVFAGAGRAVSNVEGRFVFTTAVPAPVGKRAPLLYVKIKAPDAPALSTTLFFGDDSRTATDPIYKNLKPVSRNALTLNMAQTDEGVLVGSTVITLNTKAPYRVY